MEASNSFFTKLKITRPNINIFLDVLNEGGGSKHSVHSAVQ